MRIVDWLVVAAYLVWIVYTGLKRSRATDEVEGYFLAKRSIPWWAVGLSVMATQLSAITLVGGTGQGYDSGLRFVQFYFGLPIAMVILAFTAVPFFHRARVYTAYEFLEQRFDAKTRALASLLFLASRSLSSGVIIAAPAVILSIVLGWNLTLTVLAIGMPTAFYTMYGGVQAVTWTDVRQMAVVVSGILAAIVVLIFGLPHDVSIGQALTIAGATGRMKAIDFSFNPSETYTFWSGIVGGLFLMLAYFGCDQSQVQRYLTARSIDEARSSLMMSAYVKIPLQAMVLLTGVLIFAFYLFTPPPMLFKRDNEERVRASARGGEYAELERQFNQTVNERRQAAGAFATAQANGDTRGIVESRDAFRSAQERLTGIRRQAATVVKEVTGDATYNDVNYVFPTFVVEHMPVGLVGLIIAAIFAAAMSATAGELNALGTATVIDVYRRHLKKEAPDAHYLRVSKIATGGWGLVACSVAVYATSLGSLIEVVNRFGSYFYGSLLGVFVLAIGTRRATGRGAFWGLIAGMITVAIVAASTSISFLWYNVVGAVTVVIVGMLLSYTDQPPEGRRQPSRPTAQSGL